VPDAGIAFRRESLWYRRASDVTPLEPRGRFLSGMWSAHVHPADLGHFDRFGLPLLRAMRGSGPGRAVVVRHSGATFDAWSTRHLIEQCLDVETLVMVELSGDWSTAALLVLGVVRPAFVRLRPEYTAGAAVVPEQARRLALLADYMARSSVPLVADGPLSDDDERALLAEGIDLRLVPESSGGGSPWPPLPSLGIPARPVVLDFPVRTPRP
jgi:hypothetical protein